MSVLAAQRVTVRAGSAEILREADFALRPGELVGLIGPNGAGKTTLLNALAGLRPMMAGEVTLDAVPVGQVKAQARARAIGYLEQNAVAHWPLKVERLVALGRIPHLSPLRRETAADRAAIGHAMAMCDVTGFAGRNVLTLSGGERLRVMLARVLAGEPRLLLADEPIAGLDPLHQLEVMGLLRELARGGMGIAVVLHDLTLALRYCDRLCLLARGAVVADGAPEDVLMSPAAEAAYGVRLTLGEVGGVRAVLAREIAGEWVA